MRTIGIDVGLTGAIAVVDTNWVMTYPMPIKVVKEKRMVDGKALAQLLKTLTSGSNCRIVIEAVFSRPKQGVVSVFNFAKSYGIIMGILDALEKDYSLVPPNTWKKMYPSIYGLPKAAAKNAARTLATEMYPSLRQNFLRKKDDGHAEALLIAHYGTLQEVAA